MGQFRAFLTFGQTIFGEHMSTVAVDDWTNIFQLKEGRPDNHLRLLFFPCKEDYWNDDKDDTKKNTWTLPPNTVYPRLEKPFDFQDTAWNNRRPLFLANLDDEQYIKVFRKLRRSRDLYCPTW